MKAKITISFETDNPDCVIELRKKIQEYVSQMKLHSQKWFNDLNNVEIRSRKIKN